MRLKKQLSDEKISEKFNKDEILTEMTRKEAPVKVKRRSPWSMISTILFYILLAILVVIIGFLVFGYRPAIVLSGSMRPSIQPGDVTVYKQVAYQDLEVGDVIMFRGQDAESDSTAISNVTHRIVELHLEDATPYVITHGDANSEGSNERVNVSQIQGRVEFSIPWIGIPLNFVRNNLLVFTFGAISLILVGYIISLVRNKKYEDQNHVV